MDDCNYPIYIPQALLDAAERSFPNIRTVENHLLIWFMIDSWPYADDSRYEWREMSYAMFGAVTKSRNTVSEVLQWLEKEGFIKRRKFQLDDGELVNYFIPNEEACKYRAILDGKLVPYVLLSKRYWGKIQKSTSADSLCQVTRENLGLLSEITTENFEYEDKTAENKKKNRDINSRFKLLRNLGWVNRGTNVNRLFSPWVTASSQVRKRFQLDGYDIVSIDLKAAQPTLMATMADDTKLLRDCKADNLYSGIRSLLNIDRDNAKKAFMAYAYGKNRGNWYGHQAAYKVQEWMKVRYPKTASFVRKGKTDHNYRELSIALQNKEAELFVDGMLGDLANDGLPALSVHDAIYVRYQDAEKATEIAHRHLDSFIPEGIYKMEQENITECLSICVSTL